MSQAWLKWRLEGIGSSDAPVIMGVSPWKTRYQLWREKVMGNIEQHENAAMTRGKVLEEEARKLFEEKIGISVFPRNVKHSTIDWMRASLDGLDMEGKVMVEIKCPNKEDHTQACEGNIPAKYYPQVQHQMMVTGLRDMFYFSYDGKDGVIVQVSRDESYLQKLMFEELSFWELRRKMVPPELSAKDFIDMTGDKQWESLAERWKLFAFEKDRYTNLLDNVKKEMIDYVAGKNCIGGDVMLTRSIVEGRIDLKKVQQDYPSIDWDSYRKDTTERFTIR